MRMGGGKALAAGCLAGLGAALWAGAGSASQDYFPGTFFSLSEGNTYSLFQPDTGMSVPFLAPSNDSRTNLLLLIAQARGVRPHFLATPTPFGRHGRYVAQTPVDFGTLTAVFDDTKPRPAQDTSGIIDGQGDRCRSNAASAAAYLAALRSSPATPAEKRVLGTARAAVTTACAKGDKAAAFDPANPAVTSAAGRDFAAYLAGATAFYGGDFTAARKSFTLAAAAAQPWVREAARYTVARLELNAAEIDTTGQYGQIVLSGVDAAALAKAETGFQAYLRDYPTGVYAASARGFERRVLYLRGDMTRLAELYGRAIEGRTAAGNATVLDLTYEIDNKLLDDGQGGIRAVDIRNPWLLAVVDLMRMRTAQHLGSGKPAPLSRFDLGMQGPVFAAQPELRTYLDAAYSFYVENRPADALKTLDALKPAHHMSTVRFSAQVLKGLALEALHRPAAARAQWQAVIPLSEPVLQRPAVELPWRRTSRPAAMWRRCSPRDRRSTTRPIAKSC